MCDSDPDVQLHNHSETNNILKCCSYFMEDPCNKKMCEIGKRICYPLNYMEYSKEFYQPSSTKKKSKLIWYIWIMSIDRPEKREVVFLCFLMNLLIIVDEMIYVL